MFTRKGFMSLPYPSAKIGPGQLFVNSLSGAVRKGDQWIFACSRRIAVFRFIPALVASRFCWGPLLRNFRLAL